MYEINSMKKRNLLRKIAEKLYLLRTIRCIRFTLSNIWTLEFGYGHLRSMVKWSSADKNGEPIPWYTYPAIEYLNQLDFSEKRVFEWGSGNSSIYWARRARQVISVEDDKEWYHRVSSLQKPNQKVLYCQDKEEYINSICTQNNYDIIVVDGSHRYQCSQIAPRFLMPGGMIILDNSDWYPKSAATLKESGLMQIDFKGFAPICGWTSSTSVFLSRQFSFKSLYDRQPIHGIGSLKQYHRED